MKVFIGLGNPGTEYDETRHNIGFSFIDRFHKEYDFPEWKTKFKGLYSLKEIDDEKILLIKPQTFMNSSGDCITLFKSFFKFDNENIFVFYDDMDLPFRKIKFKKGGGSGGHNGIKSLDKMIGKEYYRIRMGVGKPKYKNDVVNYVLGKFDDFSKVQELNDFLISHFINIITLDFNYIMNKNELHKIDK